MRRQLKDDGTSRTAYRRLGDVRMEKIIRQAEDWAKQAVHDMANGKAAKALAAFAERGLLAISEGRPEARAALLEQWKEEGIKKPQKNLILAGTNLDAAILNREAQSLRKKNGSLGTPYLRSGPDKLHMGDRVALGKNVKPLGIFNGQLGTVRSINPLTRTLGVRIDGGPMVHVPLNEYENIRLGYAVTTHKSQGMTTQNAFILTGESMQDMELSYVQTSRARGVTRLFTTRIEAGIEHERLAAVMSQSHQKRLAIDLQAQATFHGEARGREERQRMGTPEIQLSL